MPVPMYPLNPTPWPPPGIDAENLEAIFEEHKLSSTLDPFNPVNNEFGLRERVFNFGAVIAALQAPGGHRAQGRGARAPCFRSQRLLLMLLCYLLPAP